jgi:hypothetical protein
MSRHTKFSNCKNSNCQKTYSVSETIRQFGNEPWVNDYCCPHCYTKGMMKSKDEEQINLNDSNNKVVVYCPVRGHAPLCTNKECRKEREENNWEDCEELFKGM